MGEAFSFNREFDFVRLDGLRRATGQPAHEWDLYIIKELIDNSLDADENLWRDEPKQLPEIYIRIEYISVPELQSQQLFIQVSNRAVFPVELIEDIFATQWYTSRKAFIKGLMRGALGNALKTLLGIPYALRHRVASDWNPALKPMSILCQGTEYLPRYVVDSTAQTIQFECEKKPGRLIEGTAISVGLDHFTQEMPRTIEQIKGLAEQYHLCNPNVQFSWTVEIQGDEWEKEYGANLNWANKFRGIASVQWYSSTAFQDLLGALYRKQTGKLPVETICHCFSGFDGNTSGNRQEPLIAKIIESFGQDKLTQAEIESQVAIQLYRILCQHSLVFDSTWLGGIGEEHIQSALTNALPVESNVLYEIATNAGDDPNIPFVIEAAVAPLKESDLKEGKRLVWTAINFTPTYADPFHRRWLHAPIQPDQPVLGLRGLLDAYNLRDDTTAVLFVHLICPNVEHNEFSKTDINHLPFRQVLGQVLDRLLVAFRQAREEEELRLEQTVFQALDAILGELDQNDRFAIGQLLEKLQARFRQDTILATWLEMPDALSRLRTYITSYLNQNTVLTPRVVRSAVGTLSVPLHPDRYFSLLAEQLSSSLPEQYHVNKILYVQVRELEPVIVENGWLCRMDMALLQNPPVAAELKAAILQCVINSELPILVLHNVDEDERASVKQMRSWLEEQELDTGRIIDLGLNSLNSSNLVAQPTRLMEMMPGELANWLLDQFETLGIPAKSLPANTDLCQGISQKFEQLLLGHLWEGVSQQLEMTSLLVNLDRQLHFTQTMINQQLDEQIKCSLQEESCTKSYAAVLNQVVEEFFKDFMRENRTKLQELVQVHLKHVIEGWTQ